MPTAARLTTGQLTERPTGGPGSRTTVLRTAAIVVAALLLATLPLHGSTHVVVLVGSILVFALLVVSVDLLTGITGLATMGQTAFFGIGAYAAGMVGIHVTNSVVVQLVIGVTAASLVALVVGMFAIRTGGTVFLMVTVAIGELVYTFFDGWDFVGGSNGLAGIPAISLLPGGPSIILPGLVYWWVLLVVTVAVAAVVVVSRSPLGRSMRGVREGEERLQALGLSAYWPKLAAFVLAGAVAGAAGTAWTAQTRFISPGDFSFELSALALLSVAIGGAGTLWGPMMAAALVILVRDELGVSLEGRGVLVLGIVFVIAVYALPRGIAGWRRTSGAPS